MTAKFLNLGAKIAVFTYHGATIEVEGNLEVEPYSSKESVNKCPNIRKLPQKPSSSFFFSL